MALLDVGTFLVCYIHVHVVFIPQWVEPRRHTVVGLCVCICMSVTHVSWRPLQARY